MKSSNLRSRVVQISLIVAIAAGMAVTGLNFSRVKGKITTLQSNLSAQTAARDKAETALRDTGQKLAAANVTIKATQAALQTTTAEKQEALAAAAAQTKVAHQLRQDLTFTTNERETARAELMRYHVAGMEPEQIIAAAQEIKHLRAALSAAEQTNSVLTAQLRETRVIDGGPVVLPADLRAKVVACDPKWHFIVLDAGGKQGVLSNGELLVSRQGKLVARARVSRVQSDRCVANLMPGWESVGVLEGDVAIPAFPHS